MNLGILAHVDAGKTSLTERLLHEAGVIDEPGSVDDGNTQTDSLALERARGITIKSAVVSFAIGGDVTVNLIDTPGHPDFIAEVERVLGVLDGAVLVVSGVEGVQAQTRVLMRTLQRLRIPTLFFVNKLDRRGADLARVLGEVRAKLTGGAVLPDASCAEVLADHDDAFLSAYLEGEGDWRRELAAQTARAIAHPVFAGSAITGAGVAELIAGVREFLPAHVPDPDGPVSGTVFKVERGPAGEKVAYVRLRTGTVRLRDRLAGEKVTAISVFGSDRRDAVRAGEIARVWGLSEVRIGDALGEAASSNGRHFAPPTLETVVVPCDERDRGALHLALVQLAEQDPLINLREGDETAVSLYGEIQKEVIGATLAGEFGVEVSFRETTPIHIEKPAGTGAAVELIGKGEHGFLATVGLRVQPGPTEFRLEVELGSMPYAFFRAVEETVLAVLARRRVQDCTVTMTHAGYWARQSSAHGGFDKSMSSTAGDFRGLTPIVLLAALRQAGTTAYEPLHRFELELPADTLGMVLPALARVRALPDAPVARGEVCLLAGTLPAANVHALQQQLPGLTRGEGVMESAFERYAVMASSWTA
nr:TetM/TetW/TetO/TetS family tetracycline resistance ribosomal protection protein [Solirubrobacter ginsenosidimutans]